MVGQPSRLTGKARMSSRERKGVLKRTWFAFQGPWRYIFLSCLFLSFLILSKFGLDILRKEVFLVRKVVFIGNKHLSDKEMRILAGLTGDSLEGFSIPLESIKASIMKSPWIKNVIIRREFPDLLKIKVYEAEPLAILEMRGKSFFIDDKGRLLERLRGEAIPFLPVIISDPFKNKESFNEAINLARLLRDKHIAKERSRVEIEADRDIENISVIIDGVVIKVGYGNYDEKLERLFELEEEIRKRTGTIEYIDLRFSDRVIVKPVKEVIN